MLFSLLLTTHTHFYAPKRRRKIESTIQPASFLPISTCSSFILPRIRGRGEIPPHPHPVTLSQVTFICGLWHLLPARLLSLIQHCGVFGAAHTHPPYICTHRSVIPRQSPRVTRFPHGHKKKHLGWVCLMHIVVWIWGSLVDGETTRPMGCASTMRDWESRSGFILHMKCKSRTPRSCYSRLNELRYLSYLVSHHAPLQHLYA